MNHAPGLPNVQRFFAVVPAAGVGTRLGAAIPKQYLEIDGRSLLARSVDALLAVPWIDRVVVVVAPGDSHAPRVLAGLDAEAFARVRVEPVGGATRRDSVLAGLRALRADPVRPPEAHDWVLVHDAARPGLPVEVLERLRGALREEAVGGIAALPVADTVKRADATDHVAATVSRAGLWLAQTPQMFRVATLCDALERHPDVTDEAAAIEACGLPVRLVEGDRRNFKVTTVDDLTMMTTLLAGTAANRSQAAKEALE